MPSLLDPQDTPFQPPGGAPTDLLGLGKLPVMPPDPNQPDQGAALGQLYQTVTDYLSAQRAKSAQMGLWDDATGRPTQAGAADAGQKIASGLLFGTFGGPAAKTADIAQLSLAKDLAAKGIGRDDIWSQTGWFKGPEGNWRFEIPDEGMKVTGPIGEGSTLGSVIEHPQLFDAYPELRQTEMYQRAGTGGAFSPGTEGAPPAISIGALKDPTGVMLHEIQHNIQNMEGNVGGASPTYAAARPDLAPAFLQKYRELATNVTTPMPYEDYANAAWGGEISPASKADYLNSYLKTVPKSVPLYSDLDKTIQQTAAQDVYRRVFGEVEARTVPKRLGMTPEARSAAGPWWDWDVPESQFIIPKR
jgi:hypothetical protein